MKLDLQFSTTSTANGQLPEDEKVDKFYALIRNYKEARDRIMATERASVDGKNRRKRKRSSETPDRSRSIWTPAFKSEDFTEDCSPIQLQASPEVSPSSCNDMQGSKSVPSEIDGGGLDLRLRLALN